MTTEYWANKLAVSCKQAYALLMERIGSDDLLGFGLYSSEGYPSVGIAYSSQMGLERYVQRMEESEKELVQLRKEFPDLQLNGPYGENYYQFVTDEWDFMDQECPLSEFNEFLWETSERMGDEELDSYCAMVEALCMEGLITFRDTMPVLHETKLFIMLGISDSMIPFEKGVKWSRLLNHPEVHGRYCEFSEEIKANGNY